MSVHESTVLSIKGISADSATLPNGLELNGNVELEQISLESETTDEPDVVEVESDGGSTQPVLETPCTNCGSIIDIRYAANQFDGTTAKYRCLSCKQWTRGPPPHPGMIDSEDNSTM